MTRLASPFCFLGIASAMFVGVANAPAGIPMDADLVAKMHGRLAEVLDSAEASDLIRVSIVMRDQVARDAIQEASRTPGRQARREAVGQLLQTLADRSQKDLLARLGALEAGKAEEIHPIWIHNVVAAQLTADVVYEVLARQDVAYLNYDELVGAEVMPVAARAAPSRRR